MKWAVIPRKGIISSDDQTSEVKEIRPLVALHSIEFNEKGYYIGETTHMKLHFGCLPNDLQLGDCKLGNFVAIREVGWLNVWS
jgi:hypothetical protein